MIQDFKQVSEELGLSFNNLDFLAEALTHRSFLNEHREWKLPHNEKLEFLGDAVLGFVVADYLVQQYPELQEGALTSLRAALVNSDSLLSVAHQLQLEKYLLVSKGEAKDFQNPRSYILSNAVEALIGALYLDGGIEKARQFIQKYFFPKTEEILKTSSYKDAKSLFQEKSQEILGITPNYKTLKSWGPDHNKQFEVGVYLKDELVATGQGYSKQEAELQAADTALKLKGWQ
ncbi:MAG: ribonuclease [Patescibacteria group bacterium]|nr:ribonuclease [Patescibacteria group bacterium]